MSASKPSPRRGGRVGVRDVAQLAGVSTQTVSRVLNNSTSLREETRSAGAGRDGRAGLPAQQRRPRARHRDDADARRGGHGRHAATAPASRWPHWPAAARDAGRWIATAYADATDEASVEAALSHVLGQGVDGIVLVAPHARTRDALLNHSRRASPIVVMHGGPVDRQAEGTSLVVEHLVGLGHRRIGRLGGPADWLEELSRRAGLRRRAGRPRAGSGAELGRRLVGRGRAPAGR